jgi:hypothetical protein
VTTSNMRTASDDWFTDFDNDLVADLPIGRIPVRTAAEAATVVSKITSRSSTGPWSTRATFVSDANSTWDFEKSMNDAAALVPGAITTQKIRIGSNPSARQNIIDAMNAGQLLFDYSGHGSVELWGLSPLFGSGDATALTNGPQVPLLIAMTCLNGYFHDLYTESLAEALLKAPSGGASAVWASSTLTTPDFQETLNKELMRQLFSGSITIGEAMARAKKAVTDRDVRVSWILFGDPSMKLR